MYFSYLCSKPISIATSPAGNEKISDFDALKSNILSSLVSFLYTSTSALSILSLLIEKGLIAAEVESFRPSTNSSALMRL